MTYDDDLEGDWDDDLEDEDDEMPCPECGAPVHVESEACPSCGYWITDADRSAAWRAGSASGRIRRIGLWMIGLALLGALLTWLS